MLRALQNARERRARRGSSVRPLISERREWSYVRVDSILTRHLYERRKLRHESKTWRSSNVIFSRKQTSYVAMTRAKIAVHLPRAVMSRFKLSPTTTEPLGRESVVTSPENGETSQNLDSSLSEVVSPIILHDEGVEGDDRIEEHTPLTFVIGPFPMFSKESRARFRKAIMRAWVIELGTRLALTATRSSW